MGFLSDFWFGTDNDGIKYTTTSYSLIKMASFRRAVANFVRITTGESIPVIYNAKDSSFTDGKVIVLSAQIPNAQIDAAVGLALHEATHIIREDWNWMEKFDSHIPESVYNKALSKADLELTRKKVAKRIHSFWNWVRDRSNDAWFYEQAPGYRGYYTALYRKYFYRPIIGVALQSSKFRTPSWKGYSYRIINLHNKHRDLDALPGLREIWNIVDLKNIIRLKTSQDAFEVALKIWDIVINNLLNPPKVKKPKTGNSTPAMTSAELDELDEETLKKLMEVTPPPEGEDEQDGKSLPLPDDTEWDEEPEEPTKNPDEENEDDGNSGEPDENETEGEKENDWEDNDDLVNIEPSSDEDESDTGDTDETDKNGDSPEEDESDDTGKSNSKNDSPEDNNTGESNENGEPDENSQDSSSNDESNAGDTEPQETDDDASGTQNSDEKDTSDDDKSDSGEKSSEAEDDDKPDSGEKPSEEDISSQDKELDLEDLTEKQEELLEKAIQKQNDFLENGVEKSQLSKDQNDTLKQMEKSGASVEITGKEFGVLGIQTVVIRRLDASMLDDLPIGNSRPIPMSEEAVIEGIRLGKILAHKLQIRNETNITVYTRKTTGKIDQRLIHAVSFSDAVCSQTIYDEFGDALIHISIDASSSMDSKDKWKKTLATAVAIAKATDQIDKLDVIISFRSTTEIGEEANDKSKVTPLVVIAYDSRVDKFNKIRRIFPRLAPNGWTPEGLAYEAIMKEILQSVNGKEGYFINFSDGQPYCPATNEEAWSSRGVRYSGSKACMHTKKQVKIMTDSGIKVLSFFIDSSYGTSENEFRLMYGKNSSFINVEQIKNVAKEMNKKLLAK